MDIDPVCVAGMLPASGQALAASVTFALSSLTMGNETPHVVSVNISSGGIPKTPLDVAVVKTPGIEGDGHNHEKHNTPKQALCLFDVEGIDELKAEGYPLYPGAIGENVTIDGMDVDELEIGDRLRFSGGVEVEISKRRKPCYVLDAIDETLKKALIDRCGVYAKIITEGEMRPGETVEVMRGAGVGAEP